MKKKPRPSGFVFTKHVPKEQSPFERLFEIFQELITHTSGDFDEAIDWLRQLDEEYKITTPDYNAVERVTIRPKAMGVAMRKQANSGTISLAMPSIAYR